MKWILVSGLTFIVTFFFISFSSGQSFYSRNYTQIDGFKPTTGYEINQDDKGYLWIGSNIGAIRFDGINFQLINGDSGTFDSEILYCRPISSQRTLLLPLSHGFSYFEKGKNISSLQDAKLRGLGMPINRCFKDVITGTWWLINDGNLDSFYSFAGNTITKHRSEVRNFKCTQVINGKFFINSQWKRGNYPCVFDIVTGKYRFLTDTLGRRIENEGVLNTGDHSAYVTCLHEHGLIKIYKYPGEGSVLKLLRIIKLPRYGIGFPFITIDRNNNIWMKIVGKKGLLYYGSVFENQSNRKPQLFFSPVFVNSIFVDRNDNIWTTAPNNQLFYLSKVHFINALRAVRFPLQNIAKSIAGNKNGTICIGYSDTNMITLVNGSTCKNILLGNDYFEGCRRIYPIGTDSFIMYDRAVTILNAATAKAKKVYSGDVFKDVSFVENIVYAAGITGAVKVDFKAKSKKNLFRGRTTAIEFLRDKTLLIGTPGGLFIQTASEATVKRITNPILSRSNITDITSVNDSCVLISTNTNGLFMVSHKGDKVRPIRVPGNGVPHIRRLYRQDDRKYWLATDNGALCMLFDKNWNLLKYRNYTSFDGLPSNSVLDIGVNRDTAYLCTSLGLGIISLSTDSSVIAPADIFINSLQTDDSVIYEPERSVTLRYDQNNIMVSCSAISFESLGDIKFFYRLYPYHSKWIQVTDPKIHLTELPPGEYYLQCFAQNAIGINSKMPVNLKINVIPAFWQTNLFKFSVIFLGLFGSYIILYKRVKKNEHKKNEVVRQKRHLAELELEAIKAQINPHFIFNCLNSIQYLNYKGDYQDAQQYLEIFARIIRLTMKYSQQAFILLSDEVDYLSSYLKLEKLRFKDKLNYEIQLADGIDKNIQLPAMLVQPYVENALKHGISNTAGKVCIRFCTTESDIHITVKDNGRGFSERIKSGTLGLRISGTRAKSYNELYGLNIQVECYNESIKQGGAVVKITIPR